MFVYDCQAASVSEFMKNKSLLVSVGSIVYWNCYTQSTGTAIHSTSQEDVST
jgi:hypothetical protein